MRRLPVGHRPLTRLSYGVGTWDSTGRYVNPEPTETEFRGSFQPISRNLQRESGGERDAATHTVYGLVELKVSNPNGGPIADSVVVPSGGFAGTYQIVKAYPYDDFAPIGHYEADCIRLNETDPADPNQAVTVAEIILQTVRTMAKAACNLTDAQVVVQQASPMPRPPLPYLAVLVDTMDQQEQAVDTAGQTSADLVTATGGIEGDTYQIDAAGQSVTYTRTDTDTNADVATELANLLTATGQIESEADGAALSLVSLVLPLDTALDGTGPMTLAADFAPAYVVRGLRSGTISLWGYGNSSRPWIERIRAYLASPDGVQTQIDGGVTVLPVGDIVVESVDLGTGYEPRYASPLSLSYTLRTVAQLAVYADNISVAGSVASSGGSGLPFQVEVS